VKIAASFARAVTAMKEHGNLQAWIFEYRPENIVPEAPASMNRDQPVST
jgi:hypothetical protein